MHAAYSGLTLYMMLILVRWAAPWLQIDLWNHRLRWISQLTDPALDLVRRKLPSLGPFDFAPWALLFGVWLVREVSVSIIANAYMRL
jgi:YggT family protein